MIISSKNVGLYRDDGLTEIENSNGPKMDNIRKDIINMFKEENLSITIDINLSATDFLDISLSHPLDVFPLQMSNQHCLPYFYSINFHYSSAF